MQYKIQTEFYDFIKLVQFCFFIINHFCTSNPSIIFQQFLEKIKTFLNFLKQISTLIPFLVFPNLEQKIQKFHKILSRDLDGLSDIIHDK